MILTVDANFQLKCKDRKVKNAPPLGNGWAHWVEEQGYQEYVTEFGCQTEVMASDLSGLSMLIML